MDRHLQDARREHEVIFEKCEGLKLCDEIQLVAEFEFSVKAQDQYFRIDYEYLSYRDPNSIDPTPAQI